MENNPCQMFSVSNDGGGDGEWYDEQSDEEADETEKQPDTQTKKDPMTEQEKQMARLKTEVRGILISQQDPVDAAMINGHYRDLIGKFLPFITLGFKTIEDLLDAMPDVAERLPGAVNGRVFYKPVFDEESKHISRMVKRQMIDKNKTTEVFVFNGQTYMVDRSQQDTRKPRGRSATIRQLMADNSDVVRPSFSASLATAKAAVAEFRARASNANQSSVPRLPQQTSRYVPARSVSTFCINAVRDQGCQLADISEKEFLSSNDEKAPQSALLPHPQQSRFVSVRQSSTYPINASTSSCNELECPSVTDQMSHDSFNKEYPTTQSAVHSGKGMDLSIEDGGTISRGPATLEILANYDHSSWDKDDDRQKKLNVPMPVFDSDTAVVSLSKIDEVPRAITDKQETSAKLDPGTAWHPISLSTFGTACTSKSFSTLDKKETPRKNENAGSTWTPNSLSTHASPVNVAPAVGNSGSVFKKLPSTIAQLYYRTPQLCHGDLLNDDDDEEVKSGSDTFLTHNDSTSAIPVNEAVAALDSSTVEVVENGSVHCSTPATESQSVETAIVTGNPQAVDDVVEMTPELTSQAQNMPQLNAVDATTTTTVGDEEKNPNEIPFQSAGELSQPLLQLREHWRHRISAEQLYDYDMCMTALLKDAVNAAVMVRHFLDWLKQKIAVMRQLPAISTDTELKQLKLKQHQSLALSLEQLLLELE